MLSPLALAERTVILPAAHPLGKHWLRRSLRTDCAPVAEVEGAGPVGQLRLWQARLRPFARDVRQFLMAYSAGLLAAAIFIG